MTTRVDVEEIETTKGEKLLAAVLAGFLLVGVLWIYFHIDVERDHFARTPVPAADRAVLDRADRAAVRLRAAQRLPPPGGRAPPPPPAGGAPPAPPGPPP